VSDVTELMIVIMKIVAKVSAIKISASLPSKIVGRSFYAVSYLLRLHSALSEGVLSVVSYLLSLHSALSEGVLSGELSAQAS
jgi:hypothetical protein